jgi:hypothetical protein
MGSSGMSASTSTTAEHASTGLCSGGSGGGCGVTVRAGGSTATSAEDGATGSSVTVSSCKRHVGWVMCVCML